MLIELICFIRIPQGELDFLSLPRTSWHFLPSEDLLRLPGTSEEARTGGGGLLRAREASGEDGL